MPTFDLVIALDWSAASGRKPNPCEDRCWLSWSLAETPADERPDPEYMPTRLEAEARVRELLEHHTGARTLVAFDFAIGLPLAEHNEPVLPAGRELCAMLAERITDDPSGVNNRFEAADALNREIRETLGTPAGPFWGRPKEHAHLRELHFTKPSATGVRPLREAERFARKATKTKPKSPWQLAGIGSVGSQQLMGLPTVHRLLTHHALAGRAHLWPFEPAPDAPNGVTIGEMYPALFPERSPTHWYKDARQVTDARDALLATPIDEALATPTDAALARSVRLEGWILGLPAHAVRGSTPEAAANA